MGYGSSMAKGFAPATERNRQPILDLIRSILPQSGLVLEVASGTGQHARFFAEALPNLRWQPSDTSPDALRSIRAWVDEAGCETLLAPLELDVRWPEWPLAEADAVICINMIHISPWACTEALFERTASLLAEGAPLVTYGPYRLHGRHTSESNAAFDESLRARDPAWGVRDVDDLVALGSRTGFSLAARYDMPANNMTLHWQRTP